MIKSITASTRLLVLAAFLLLPVSPFLLAKEASRGSASRAGIQLTQANKSSKKVTLLLHRTDDNTDITITQFVDKAMTFEYRGLSYSITPSVDDQTQQINLKISRINRDLDYAFGVDEAESLSVDSKAESRSKLGLPFTMKLQQLSESPGEGKPASDDSSHAFVSVAFRKFAFQDAETCCVTCNGLRSCACAVDAACGSCCASYCCRPNLN
ncbi:MAG TPA: hypothetical protein VEZ90_15350 [Blastocatellia bacterium]|nr:hypothetical protein [Blastocatellia bacterium]